MVVFFVSACDAFQGMIGIIVCTIEPWRSLRVVAGVLLSTSLGIFEGVTSCVSDEVGSVVLQVGVDSDGHAVECCFETFPLESGLPLLYVKQGFRVNSESD